ncbi:octicosapeptide/Phox/Bem1p family protein [Actinidia rufa]|uniref:Octicosapeptide/Phox/Bem1p family protein n=1 Tax=Actinidia rufa TaxID=165716 RepID=A0A7J0EWW8_9ERIC|nr:octicosapeptide/Phox/Bem1p family protein [Actinidia rufa]
MDNHNSDSKVKLMCSYGGRIQQRPHDHQLAYIGGDTKILAVDRHVKFADIVAKLISLFNAVTIVSFKYQLPGEDLDALVSVINDDDLEHMMAEYDRIHAGSPKPARIRLFLFAPNLPKPKNGSITVPSSAQLNPDFLFGFDKEYEYDCQTGSIPESKISMDPLRIGPDIPGLDPPNRRELHTQIQECPFAGFNETLSRESPVTCAGLVVYRIPVAAGGYPIGIPPVRVVYREQPVYSFVPEMTEQKLGFGADGRRLIAGVGLEEGGIGHVASDAVGDQKSTLG